MYECMPSYLSIHWMYLSYIHLLYVCPVTVPILRTKDFKGKKNPPTLDTDSQLKDHLRSICPLPPYSAWSLDIYVK